MGGVTGCGARLRGRVGGGAASGSGAGRCWARAGWGPGQVGSGGWTGVAGSACAQARRRRVRPGAADRWGERALRGG
ncbi:hypothetical protein STVIR_0474 [Streptomyces viridochromogenes Tue57]|uniref:Uncharacterized protein n=1 Tax=Streptomyces viridochromogenes Tue57 TaxID=1160705 RepID=L8PRE2_STRVR|nr:hypothetical protein STVIR_0474 [Streptomyces viridochromogenes Tue57]